VDGPTLTPQPNRWIQAESFVDRSSTSTHSDRKLDRCERLGRPPRESQEHRSPTATIEITGLPRHGEPLKPPITIRERAKAPRTGHAGDLARTANSPRR
jgi:hypothetical protein